MTRYPGHQRNMAGVHPPHVQCPNCTVDRYRDTLPARRT